MLTCYCGTDFEVAEDSIGYWMNFTHMKRGDERTCYECNAPLPAVEVLETPMLIIYSVPVFEGRAHYSFMTEEEARDFDVDLSEEVDGKPYGLFIPIENSDGESWEGDEESACCADVFIDDFLDAFYAETGWFHGDYERWERKADRDLRCHRCQGIAESIAGAGYCEPAIGDLIEDHEDFTKLETGCTPMEWVRGPDGVLNPRKKLDKKVA